jgi:hypothetical protein
VETEDDLDALERAVTGLRKFPIAKLRLLATGPDPVLLRRAFGRADGVLLETLSDDLHFDGAALRVLVGDAIAWSAPLGFGLVVEDHESPADLVDVLVTRSQCAQDAGAQTFMSIRGAGDETVHAYRQLAVRAAQKGVRSPFLLQADIAAHPDSLQGLLEPSIQIGSLLCDGIGDAVVITGREDTTALAFNILQAAGARLSKTDYVACPSCGRTLFDLQETTERIKKRTAHLAGVRLAIMGCIVNGPGEMADADFGYVGGAPGRVNLYVGKECVEKGVPADEADDRLIALIKAHGKWKEANEDDETADTLPDLSPEPALSE